MSKPVILFESYPDFSGSPLEIYNELVRRGYDKIYDLVWAVGGDFNRKTDYKIIKFHWCYNPQKKQILDRTKIIIDSNRYIQKPRKDVYRLCTRHGLSFKKTTAYCSKIGPVDAILTTSDEMMELDKKSWPSHLEDKYIVTGLPVTDRLFNKVDLYENGFIKYLTGTDNRYNKIIGWIPTYRQHRSGGTQAGKVFKYGVPIINSLDDYNKLNEKLKEQNSILLIHRHHAQAKNYTDLPKVSNIYIVTESDKQKFNLTTHNLMNSFDAMITDYSSAYFEYIILDRPIGLTVDDMKKYHNDLGFYCNYFEWIKGFYILDIDFLINFVTEVSNNIDSAKTERDNSMNKIHKFVDNNATIRVVDYLEEKVLRK